MVDVCEDCRLQLAPDRKTRNQRVGYMYCAARFSPHYELQCKRVAVHLLRSDLTSANERAVAAAKESLRLAGLLEVERGRVGLMEAERGKPRLGPALMRQAVAEVERRIVEAALSAERLGTVADEHPDRGFEWVAKRKLEIQAQNELGKAVRELLALRAKEKVE